MRGLEDPQVKTNLKSTSHFFPPLLSKQLGKSNLQSQGNVSKINARFARKYLWRYFNSCNKANTCIMGGRHIRRSSAFLSEHLWLLKLRFWPVQGLRRYDGKVSVHCFLPHAGNAVKNTASDKRISAANNTPISNYAQFLGLQSSQWQSGRKRPKKDENLAPPKRNYSRSRFDEAPRRKTSPPKFSRREWALCFLRVTTSTQTARRPQRIHPSVWQEILSKSSRGNHNWRNWHEKGGSVV